MRQPLILTLLAVFVVLRLITQHLAGQALHLDIPLAIALGCCIGAVLVRRDYI